MKILAVLWRIVAVVLVVSLTIVVALCGAIITMLSGKPKRRVRRRR